MKQLQKPAIGILRTLLAPDNPQSGPLKVQKGSLEHASAEELGTLDMVELKQCQEDADYIWVSLPERRNCGAGLSIEEQRRFVASFNTLLEICRWKCGPHDEVILKSGKSNQAALVEAAKIHQDILKTRPELIVTANLSTTHPRLCA